MIPKSSFRERLKREGVNTMWLDVFAGLAVVYMLFLMLMGKFELKGDYTDLNTWFLVLGLGAWLGAAYMPFAAPFAGAGGKFFLGLWAAARWAKDLKLFA